MICLLPIVTKLVDGLPCYRIGAHRGSFTTFHPILERCLKFRDLTRQDVYRTTEFVELEASKKFARWSLIAMTAWVTEDHLRSRLCLGVCQW